MAIQLIRAASGNIIRASSGDLAKSCNCCDGISPVDCTTTVCDDATAPGSWGITISGIGNDSCSNCADRYNDTFVTTTFSSVGSLCIWQYIFPDTYCGTGVDRVELILSASGGDLFAQLLIRDSGATFTIAVTDNTGISAPASCYTALDGYDFTSGWSASGSICDVASAAATIFLP